MSTHILVIEDNATNLELMTHLLQFGYSVISAKNDLLGIEIAKKELPDLILCDIHMSPMNGYEVMRVFQNQA